MRIHTLTTEQLKKLTDAIGDGSDWPKHTDDPQVNYAIDCVVVHGDGELPPYSETGHMYVEEVRLVKQLGL